MQRRWQFAVTSAVIILLTGCSGPEPGGTPDPESGVVQDEQAERINWNRRAPWAQTRQDATRESKAPFKIYDNVY